MAAQPHDVSVSPNAPPSAVVDDTYVNLDDNLNPDGNDGDDANRSVDDINDNVRSESDDDNDQHVSLPSLEVSNSTSPLRLRDWDNGGDSNAVRSIHQILSLTSSRTF